MAAMFALYHGPQGLKHIAERTHNAARILAEGKQVGLKKTTWNQASIDAGPGYFPGPFVELKQIMQGLHKIWIIYNWLNKNSTKYFFYFICIF